MPLQLRCYSSVSIAAETDFKGHDLDAGSECGAAKHRAPRQSVNAPAIGRLFAPCAGMERRRLPRPQRILLVDDAADVREMWRLWLTLWGFAVDEAADGSEALQKAQEHRPDLVLMDLWLPVLDGLDTTRALRADASTATVPVIALSANHPWAAAAVTEAGCDSYLPKPLNPDALLEALRTALRIERVAGPPAAADQ